MKSGDVDFGKTAADYGRYRVGFPASFFARLASAYGIGQRGQRVLDVGCGTGSVARGFARRGCSVTGLDKSRSLVDEARRLDGEAGVVVDYVIASAEDTGLPSAHFDVVTAGQCWHWFDRPRAAAEARRLLVDGGAVVIGHFDWLPMPGNVVADSEALIREHNPSWDLGSAPSGGSGVYGAWLVDVAGAGFVDIETFSYDVVVPYTHEAWRGRIRASAGVAASLAPGAVARFDEEHARLLREHHAQEPLPVPHRVWAVVARAPGRSPSTSATPQTRPRAIAIAVVRRGERILVMEGRDDVKGETFYRPLGGAIEFGESAADAVKRELREEIGVDYVDVRRQLAVFENRFVYDGKPGHEIVFVLECTIADAALGDDVIVGREDDGAPLRVLWKPLSDFVTLIEREGGAAGDMLYPVGLLGRLRDVAGAR